MYRALLENNVGLRSKEASKYKYKCVGEMADSNGWYEIA
jgi:hypothetical protein